MTYLICTLSKSAAKCDETESLRMHGLKANNSGNVYLVPCGLNKYNTTISLQKKQNKSRAVHLKHNTGSL